ncbi:hypothetical protein L218DRAFT_709648 [Marasmius fiardii PR-910]|nr:hypothetical protein L218DRAFT_709648 [Marasmius fiardii PR-910]
MPSNCKIESWRPAQVLRSTTAARPIFDDHILVPFVILIVAGTLSFSREKQRTRLIDGICVRRSVTENQGSVQLTRTRGAECTTSSRKKDCCRKDLNSLRV